MSRTFHLGAIPHTRPTPAFSHCAFTTKTRLLPRLLKLAFPDCRVHYYGVMGDVVAGVDVYTPIWTPAQWESFYAKRHADKTAFVGVGTTNVSGKAYREFNQRLGSYWQDTFTPGDVACFPFGHGHQQAWGIAHRSDVLPVETGIGYPTCFLPYRIYESWAWLHYVAGLEKKGGHDYHFVAPASFAIDEWDVDPMAERGGDIVYMGRLARDKGLNVLRAIADAMPERNVVMYGQGNPSWWEGGNLRYGGVLTGDERLKVLTEAAVVVCPTRYIEPFCQTHIEALLCGTRVVGSPHSIFAEHANRKIHLGVGTARTLDEWVTQINWAIGCSEQRFDRGDVMGKARRLFSLETVSRAYRDAITTMLGVLTPAGWYGSHHVPSPSTEVALT